jgi:hypothetical protein
MQMQAKAVYELTEGKSCNSFWKMFKSLNRHVVCNSTQDPTSLKIKDLKTVLQRPIQAICNTS